MFRRGNGTNTENLQKSLAVIEKENIPYELN